MAPQCSRQTQGSKSSSVLDPGALKARAEEAIVALETLAGAAISAKVDRLAEKLLGKGLVTRAPDDESYLPGWSVPRSIRYAEARNAPARGWRRAEFGIRRALNRPRVRGSKAFKSGGDARTLVSTVTGSSAAVWANSLLFRTGLNVATSSAGPGFEAPAGGLEALGIAGGVAAGCSLLDGLDMFNTFLDMVDEQDRWKVEVVVFHRHFKQYLDDRKTGSQSSPEVVHGFRRCQAALSRCALFDKPTRQAWRRCCAAALRDTGLSSVTALLGVAGMGMKIHAGADLASLGLGTAGMALGAAALPFSIACAGIDIGVGLGEIGFRKKEYRSCRAKCLQIQRQIDRLTTPAAGHERTADQGQLVDVLKGALKRQRRLMKQARYEKRFGIARVAKGVANAAVTAPLATAAVVAGAVAAAAVAWPIGLVAGLVGGVVTGGYLASYVTKAATRQEMRGRSRSEQYDATILAATTSAEDRTRLFAEQATLSVAGTEGYWTGGRDAFAGRYIHTVTPETQVVAALDEFAGLLARRPTNGHPDAEVETQIQDFLAIADIDATLLNDIERMIRSRSDELRAQGEHPRDIEWHELTARREQYAAAFGLPATAPKLPIGALLPSFHAACWIARLGESVDPEAGKFASLLDRHLMGEQVDLHAMNEWLERNGHLATSSALTKQQMQSAAERLFRSVPPALFMDHMNALTSAITKETANGEAFRWQDDSPVLRDLTAFREFARDQWIPGHQALSRIVAHPAVGAGGVAKGVRACTTEELSAALQHLASGCSMPPCADPPIDRDALSEELRGEWARRFAVDTPRRRRRTAAALARHCATHGKFRGNAWTSDGRGGFSCDLGGCKSGVIRASALAKWVRRGDWNDPLPVEIRSLAPALALRWLTNETGSGVDERFLGEAGVAPTLKALRMSFEMSAYHPGMRLHDRVVSRDGIAPHHEGAAGPSQFRSLEEAMGPARRAALGDLFSRSTRPWTLLERTLDGAQQWQSEVAGKQVVYPSFEAAVQACCDQQGVEAVRVVFLTNPT
ncbi:hypothetical protein ASE08_08770 [Rhizobacter sp. Root16D2]|nr:hypothetical protein ASC88_14675 [Rhizobacter sp. Root29]KQW04338.1 hypothetical protein ASC98_04365 [Rhizobacter sp. Root1238]KRB14530.1 hypothetical protein ASE08_08770 [Rhizobacter sp. Root16D2]